jgi:hypothetical protein
VQSSAAAEKIGISMLRRVIPVRKILVPFSREFSSP